MYVVDEIERLQREGVSLVDIAVLYRTNYQSRAIEEAFLKGGLPYKLVGGFRFYDRKEIKDILSYMRYVYNLKDDLSITRILNIPTRKIGPKSVAKIHEVARKCGCSVGELIVGIFEIQNLLEKGLNISNEKYLKIEESISEMKQFDSLIQLFGSIFVESRDLDALSTIDLILRKTKYVEYIDDGSEEAQYKIENIEELKNVASTYSQRYQEKSLEMFLQEINLIEQEQNKNQDGSGNYVNLMTLHSSKGLEFEYVFIVGMEEGYYHTLDLLRMKMN